LGWAILTHDPLKVSRGAGLLWILIGLALLLFAVQLVPLPPSFWMALPGRPRIVESFASVNLSLGWMPISLTPYKTLEAIPFLLPPLAFLAGALRFKPYREAWLVAAMLAATLAAILLGILQVTSPDQSWYLYRFSAFGFATGFFANSNHMGTLLLVSVPFLIALVSSQWARAANVRLRSLILALAAGAGGVILLGLLLNGSFAVLLLGAPVGLVSILLLPFERFRNRRRLWLAAALLAAMLALAVTFRAEFPRLVHNSVETRVEIWGKSWAAVSEYWPSGSGIGSFQQIYQQQEVDGAAVDGTYVNDAHNDYLQLLVETGLAGVVMIVAFLCWWAGRVIVVWKSDPNVFAQAATIASAAILLHSMVDYPLRTAAIAVVMAMCLAMMTRPRITVRSQTVNDLWPTRHLRVD